MPSRLAAALGAAALLLLTAAAHVALAAELEAFRVMFCVSLANGGHPLAGGSSDLSGVYAGCWCKGALVLAKYSK